MPEYLRLLLMGHGINTQWLYVDTDPPSGSDNGNAPESTDPIPSAPKPTAAQPKQPAESPASPVDVEALQAQITALKAEVQAKDSVVSKLRPFERNWKKVAGDLTPDRLTELQQSEQKLLEAQQQQQLEDQYRDAAAQEYTPKIQEKDSRIQALESKLAAVEMRYNLSTAFSQNGGIGQHFEGFLELASGNFKSSEQGRLNAYDDFGNMVMVTDPKTKQDRAATPGEFVKMISNGSLEKSGYVLSKLPLLKYTVEAYNKSSGSDLPRQNGNSTTANLDDLSQSELAGIAFKS
ncbi:MAG: hypothetical protein AAF810_17325 [Cyanobacteria bacterium P01_D01_bin.36]